jgi:hypothetical protein
MRELRNTLSFSDMRAAVPLAGADPFLLRPPARADPLVILDFKPAITT